MGCECADLSSRVGQFCRLSENVSTRAPESAIVASTCQSNSQFIGSPTSRARPYWCARRAPPMRDGQGQRQAPAHRHHRRNWAASSSAAAVARSSVTAGVRQPARRAEPNAARRSVGSRVARAQSVMTTMPAGSPSASTVRSAALSSVPKVPWVARPVANLPRGIADFPSRCIPMHSLPRE